MKPPQYRINDLNTLIPSVVHTYHPKITEPPNVHHQDSKQLNNSFELSHSDLYKDPILNYALCNIQPSRSSAPRVFPHLADSKQTLKFLKNYNSNTLIWMNLSKINYAEFLMEQNTVMLTL